MPRVSGFTLLSLLLVSSLAVAQSTTQEDLGSITAAKSASGLGWTVNAVNEVEFAAAAAAGATHVRIDSCEWAIVEGQSAPPNNVSTGYSLPAGCITGFNYAKKYGLQPTVLAAYGAPYHQILTLTLTSTAAAGATTLSVAYSDNVGGHTLSSIAYPYDYVANADGTNMSKKHSYSGTLITNVALAGSSAANLTLSSALTAALPAGTTLYVNEILYPSPATGSGTDPSTVAYAQYAQYLATQVKAYGLTGDVELWNEPPWGEDCWDNRRDCYDSDPGFPNELQSNSPNYGLAAAVQTLPAVAGVTYVWAGTDKSGSADLLGTRMAQYSGAGFNQPQQSLLSESMHPYGSNPEDAMWNEPCLLANPKAGVHCNTIPGSTSNYVIAETQNLLAKSNGAAYGINHAITETGASSLYMPADHMARFATRQYLGFMASGMSYVEFYRLYDNGTPGQTGFGFTTLSNNNTAYAPLPAYTALAGLMADLAPIQALPVASYSASSLPSVLSYSGTYNLDHLSIVGSRSGDSSNSILYALWQRSYSSTMCQIGVTVPCWASVPQPAAAPVTVTIPPGMKITEAVNLVTRAAVSYSQSGPSVTLSVSDDPIELMFIPSGSSNTPAISPRLIFESIANQTQGNSVVVHATSASAGAITYSVVSGPATVSGSSVTATGPGTVVLKALQAAKGNYASATATASFIVTAKTPVITFPTIPPRTFGDVVTVHGGSASSGAITYSIASGPATISGTTVTTTGIGTVVIQASQAASGVYIAATATTSFTVSPKAPTLSFTSIPGHIYGDVFSVSASSASSGAVTYSVTSGPATLSGSTLTTTGSGEVWLQASQVASGGYSAATATASFYVGVATPKLVFAPIPAQPYNSTFTVSATSASSNAVIYAVVSGPARISGSTVTTQSTAGTVVLKADQPGGGSWAATSTTTSFTVAATVAPTLTFASISSKTQGDVFAVSATSASSGAVTYSVTSGPATIAGSTVTLTGAGTVVLKASQAASGTYNAATATTSFTVAAMTTPTLTFASISSKNQGDVFAVSATSASSGAVIYSVASGPATIAGSTVTATGAGTVVLHANQTASGTYSAATATTSFTVAAKVTPTLAFASIPSKNQGDVFAVSATSASSGAVTYSVASGPATVSGSTVTATGAGTVVLQASQAASGTYNAATATTSFTVAALPTLAFNPIPAKNSGDVFPVSVISPSPGAVTYSVVSGPAIMVAGSTCEAIGAGTVVLKAVQAASGTYPQKSAQTSFTSTGQAPLALTFQGINSKVYGDAFNVKATSASPGAVTYSVVSGAASIAGSTVTITGSTGTATLQASQAASGKYPAATTTITFPISPLAPALALTGISSQSSGSTFKVSATSPSKGKITYTVVSGPAKISNGTVTVTGPGTVVLRADQAASGGYGPAHTMNTFQAN